MTCNMCDNSKPLRKELKNIKFDECGLDYVTLENVPVYYCSQCGEEYREIPKAGELLEQIAKSLVFKKGRLSGKEVTFLRKFLGFSRRQLSKFFEYTYETWTRFENENPGYEVPRVIDKAIRIIVLSKVKCPPYEFIDAMDNGGLKTMKRMVAEPTEKGWQIEAA